MQATNHSKPRVLKHPSAPKNTPSITPPNAPGEWSLKQIQEALKRPLPRGYLQTKRVKGKTITFIPWFRAVEALDKYAPSWQWEIRETSISADRIFVVGRLSIPTCDGVVYREATGTEVLKRITDEGEIAEVAYGDPSSNAESMAYRRAAAKFGLALYLYG